ncbi:MAG: hypothetical protein U0172_03585 [Nitrospiraceae bacterium]
MTCCYHETRAEAARVQDCREDIMADYAAAWETISPNDADAVAHWRIGVAAWLSQMPDTFSFRAMLWLADRVAKSSWTGFTEQQAYLWMRQAVFFR